MTLTVGSTAVVTSPPFTDAAGTTPAATDILPSLAVTRDDGTAVTPSAGPIASTDPGVYQATIAAADLDQPDRLTLTWTGDVGGVTQQLVEAVEVAGGVYLRLFDLVQIKDLSKYDPATLDALRGEFEELAERYTGRAWVRRFASEIHPPTTVRPFVLDHLDPRLILSAIDDTGEAADVSAWAVDPIGQVTLADDPAWSSGLIILSRQTTVRYVHGADSPPVDLVLACKDYVRSKALERFGGNRAGRDVLSYSDGSGVSTRYSTPDWDAGRPTGLLDVDRVLNALLTPLGFA